MTIIQIRKTREPKFQGEKKAGGSSSRHYAVYVKIMMENVLRKTQEDQDPRAQIPRRQKFKDGNFISPFIKGKT